MIKGTILTSTLMLWAYPGSLQAEESSSFKLYHEAFQYGERGPSESDSYKANEDGVAWNAKPLTSNSFQIVSSPPAASTASTTTPVVDEEAEATTPSGGRRGQGTTRSVRGIDPSEPSDDEELNKPSASDEDEVERKEPLTELPFVDVDFTPLGVGVAQDGGAGYSRGKSRISVPRYFRKVEQARETQIIINEKVVSHQAAKIIKQGRNLQVALMFTQAISALCFLIAFQLLLSKVPYKLLKK